MGEAEGGRPRVRIVGEAEERALGLRRLEVSAAEWRASPERAALIVSASAWARRIAGREAARRRGFPYDEALSLAFEAVIRSVDAFDPRRGRLTTLVSSAARNLLNHDLAGQTGPIRLPRQARDRAFAPRVGPMADRDVPAGDAPEPWEAMAEREEEREREVVARRIRDALASLPRADAELLREYYLSDSPPTHRAIADREGVTREAIFGRLKAARGRLALALGAEPGNGRVDRGGRAGR